MGRLRQLITDTLRVARRWTETGGRGACKEGMKHDNCVRQTCDTVIRRFTQRRWREIRCARECVRDGVRGGRPGGGKINGPMPIPRTVATHVRQTCTKKRKKLVDERGACTRRREDPSRVPVIFVYQELKGWAEKKNMNTRKLKSSNLRRTRWRIQKEERGCGVRAQMGGAYQSAMALWRGARPANKFECEREEISRQTARHRPHSSQIRQFRQFKRKSAKESKFPEPRRKKTPKIQNL